MNGVDLAPVNFRDFLVVGQVFKRPYDKGQRCTQLMGDVCIKLQTLIVEVLLIQTVLLFDFLEAFEL